MNGVKRDLGWVSIVLSEKEGGILFCLVGGKAAIVDFLGEFVLVLKAQTARLRGAQSTG